MAQRKSPSAYAGSPKEIDRTPFNLTLRTERTAHCPACGNQLNTEATGIKYGIAWCWICFQRQDDYPLRVAMMIICEPHTGHFTSAKGISIYTPRLNNPGSFPSLVDRLNGGPGRTDIPDYGETWPRWIPPHAEVIIYALEYHLLHPDVLICNEHALRPKHNKNGLTVLP